MSTRLVIAAVTLLAIVSSPVLAGDRDPATLQRHGGHNAPTRTLPVASVAQGQYPAPAEIAARSALPLCGFAATESWGPNGFQYCDARNVHGDVSSWDLRHRSGNPHPTN